MLVTIRAIGILLTSTLISIIVGWPMSDENRSDIPEEQFSPRLSSIGGYLIEGDLESDLTRLGQTDSIKHRLQLRDDLIETLKRCDVF